MVDGCYSKLDDQTGFPGGIRQGGHSAVILILASVQGDRGDTRLKGPAGDGLTHRGGGVYVSAKGDFVPQLLIDRA
ncbi:hypothetical protein LCGC14_2292760, partial [marine sediment metagenome]